MIMSKGVSVIVCCYNSALRLPETIRHIVQQETPAEIDWEVVIVNNSSTDNTLSVARAEWGKHLCSASFKMVDQPVPGLSAAREKGMEVSRFDYVVFCDDDNWLDKNYISNAFYTMESHTDAGIAAGQSAGYFEVPKPFWFDSFAQSYVVEKVLPASGYLPPCREYLAGAGMVVRRDLINDMKAVEFKSILTDRIGTNLMSGGDYELCLVAQYLGYRIYYDERLTFVHFMPKDRLTWNYFIRMTSQGQAIPDLIHDLYRAGHKAEISKIRQPFCKLYLKLLKDYINALFYCEHKGKRSLRFFFLHLNLFFRMAPGSLLQKNYLSSRNKIIFLIKNRRLLNRHYISIQELFGRISRAKQNP